jgi:TfoX/Sxy family transcriptional regulator of competence genes
MIPPGGETMAFDEKLAERVRGVLVRRPGVSERKMFGGLAFLREGRMFCGVLGADLVVRVGPQAWGKALGRRHVRPMDFTGRPMTGYVYVAPAGVRAAASLRAWVEQGLAFSRTLDVTGSGRSSPAAGGRSGSRRR